MIHFNQNIDSSLSIQTNHKKKLSVSSASQTHEKFTIEYKDSERKDSSISVKLIDPLQKKPVFQTQVQAPIVSVPPTLIVEDIMSDPEDGSKIKYHCPNCQLGELVINYEHEGDCRHDYFIYDCCSACMILCPECCGGVPKYRICTLCKTEFDWEKN